MIPHRPRSGLGGRFPCIFCFLFEERGGNKDHICPTEQFLFERFEPGEKGLVVVHAVIADEAGRYLLVKRDLLG